MRFTCPRCGKKYASADEPAPGRTYSLTCRCGTKITVKGPEARPPGAPELTPASAAGGGFDLFPTERRRTQGGAPVSNVDTGSLPSSPRGGEPTPSSSWAASTHTDRVPLREATPAPAPARPTPAPHAARGPAAPLDPFANFPAPAASPAAPRSAPLDPFADMPDLQAEARGEARPLTSVPDIRGPVPEPPAGSPSYDPFAAQHGLLLDEREARAIAGQAPALEPQVPPAASGDDEPEAAFSREVPAAPKGRARAVIPKVASRGRGRLLLAAIALAVVGGGAGAAWFFLGRTRSSPPTQAVPRPPPAPTSPPVAAVPAPTPAPVATAPAPTAAAAPAPPATPAPAPAPVAAAPAPPAEARPEPRHEAPRKAEPSARRAPRRERQVAAAPEAAPRPEPERPEPPPKPEEPRKPAPEAVARRPEAPPSAPPAAPVRTELTSAEVGASIKASAKAFDACVAEAARNEPNLQVVGRRVGLYITVNPTGVVSGPRLDDAALDDSVLGACLKTTARKMVFPAFQGESFQVRIPMVLGGAK